METYSTMVRGWGGLVSWCRLVSWCGLVGRSRCCVSTVLNISNVSIVSINSVSYSLGTAVREENIVFSTGYSAISGFSLTKVDICVVILNIISIAVTGWTIRWFLV